MHIHVYTDIYTVYVVNTYKYMYNHKLQHTCTMYMYMYMYMLLNSASIEIL